MWNKTIMKNVEFGYYFYNKNLYEFKINNIAINCNKTK